MTGTSVSVRSARAADANDIEAVHTQAFGQDGEAALVSRLNDSASPIVSLVAESDGVVCAHIMFSPVTLEPAAELNLMGLAPLAVRPGQQRKGIGSRLVREGLVRCRELGADAIVVLGQPEFYAKFGFSPAIGAGISSTFDGAGDAFMLLELTHGCLRTVGGTVHFHEAFDEL